MTKKYQTVNIAVSGMDGRQNELAKELKLRYQPSAVTQIDSPASLTNPVDYLVLPLKGIDDVLAAESWLSHLDPGTTILAGKTTAAMQQACEKYHIDVISYIDRTEFKIANAVPTAEGAIKLYMELSKQTVAHSRMLVLGFGHCGKALALRLKAWGADVTVFARNYEDRIAGKSMGLDMREYKDLPKLARQKTCIFNTIPYKILDASILSSMPKTSLIIDLASLPGGTDFKRCEELSLPAVHALSLPGTCFPITAGNILADTIVNIINETS